MPASVPEGMADLHGALPGCRALPWRAVNGMSRLRLARFAVLACSASVLWALAVGIAVITAGAAAQSLALVAFGLDTLVDGFASAVLVWRFRLEGRSSERADRVENVALRIVGWALLVSAIYVAVQAISELATGSRPTRTTVGLALAGASVLVLPLLAFVKLRLARGLDSAALRGDSVLSAAGGALAGTALLGVALVDAFGFGWADPTAAMLIAAALAREGWRVVS